MLPMHHTLLVHNTLQSSQLTSVSPPSSTVNDDRDNEYDDDEGDEQSVASERPTTVMSQLGQSSASPQVVAVSNSSSGGDGDMSGNRGKGREETIVTTLDGLMNNLITLQNHITSTAASLTNVHTLTLDPHNMEATVDALHTIVLDRIDAALRVP
jgi:hypothetical protein